VEELSEIQTQPDEELLELLNGSWTRITNFASLFKVLPVKQRRQRRQVSARDLEASIEAVSKLAPTGKVVVEYRISVVRVSLVLAELDSVLLNLVSNAVKAINASPRADEGKISIQLGDVEGQNLEISVADNGCGVSSKVARVLFEPLEGEFSEGTGMGLSIVRFIAERYGGDVRMNSKAPRGYTTQFVATFKDVVR